MSQQCVIIGAGHNALVAAFYLAKSGHRPLVLERRPVAGGCATSEEFAPGYRAATLAHALGPIRPDIVRDMQLERRGVTFVAPDPRIVSVTADGRALAFSRDPARTAEAIRAVLRQGRGALSGLLRHLRQDWPLPGAARRHGAAVHRRPFDRRDVGVAAGGTPLSRARQEGCRSRLLRWGPMAVADLVAEWFETDLLQASDRRARRLRDGDGALVGGDRRDPAAGVGDRPAAGRQQRDRDRRPWRRDARRWPRRRVRPAPRFEPAPKWCGCWSRTARSPASCWPTAARSPRPSWFQERIRGARSWDWSTPSIWSRIF